VDERDPKKALRPAYNQFQTYKADIPSLFVYNELLVISDGFAALAGTLTSGWDRFMPWRTISVVYNELLVISDGFAALAGTLTSGWDRFMPWRTISGTEHYLHPIPLPPTPLPGGNWERVAKGRVRVARRSLHWRSF